MSQAQEVCKQTDPLAYYGDSISEYLGQGTLMFKDNTTVDCEFIALQLSKGTILLKCDFPFSEPFCREVPIINFRGITAEGREVSASKGFTKVSLSDHSVVFLIEEMYVRIPNSRHINRIQFGITNFEFLGTDVEVTQSGWSNTTNLNISGERLSINKKDPYEIAMGRLFASKGVEVTCEIIADISEEND
ncbi:MAG: hypothetical protein WB392_13445, partial [Methanotrichaceae archaeon]